MAVSGAGDVNDGVRVVTEGGVAKHGAAFADAGHLREDRGIKVRVGGGGGHVDEGVVTIAVPVVPVGV